MLLLNDGVHLIQEVADLPDLSGADELFLDVETNGLQPYHGNQICGVAVTVNEEKKVWYVPVRHRDKDWNIPEDAFRRWLQDILSTCKDWNNHNIIFDAHFCALDGAVFQGRLVDTLTLCKLHNSDRMSYGLKPIARDWLDMPMEEVDKVEAYLDQLGQKKSERDYSAVPADILGAYACEDVISNRKLYRFLDKACPDSVRRVWENEIALTPVMFDIEDFGMPIDRQEVKIETVKAIQRQINYGAELHELINYELNPNSSPQIYDCLINQFGLPVVAYNEDSGNPSFDKAALALYSVHPAVLADEKLLRVVELIGASRKEIHFQSLFLDPYSELNVDGILHPSYNQCVRTGRMSCRQPNAQQLNKRAKALIHPRPGMAILSADFSQIEFRLIVHYINDMDAIASFNEDPKTDFHQWVADQCGIKRGPGKILNFAMGFGAGKKKVVSMLQPNPDIIEEVSQEINQMIEEGRLEERLRNQEFNIRCHELAESMYNIYHERLPGVKRTARRAGDAAKKRGFVFNAYGRRRHLEGRFCYRGFNAVVQSSAADVMKSCTLKVAPRYNKWVRDLDIHLMGLVHDEFVFMGPEEVLRDPEVLRKLREPLQTPDVQFKVPITIDMGLSAGNWAEASGDDQVLNEDGEHVSGPIEF